MTRIKSHQQAPTRCIVVTHNWYPWNLCDPWLFVGSPFACEPQWIVPQA
jgi:hypothetical protein